MKNLENEYFYNKDGSLDEFVRYLDCNSLPLYYILKSKISSIKNPYDVFMQDISFCLKYKNDIAIYDIAVSPDYNLNTRVFREIHNYQGKGIEAENALWDYLSNDGNMAVVHTYIERVPFNRVFRSFEETKRIKESLHFFLAVGCDEKKLYYVDMHENLNPEYFVAHPENSCVGVIQRELLRPAFEIFLNFYAVEIDTKALLFSDRFSDICSSFKKYYSKTEQTEDNISCLYGINAIMKLKEYAFNESVSLTEITEFNNCSIHELFCWKFFNIISNRKLLLGYLEKNLGKKGHEKIYKSLSKNIDCWEKLKHEIDTALIRGETVLGKKYVDYFLKLEEQEKEFKEMIEKL